MPNKRIYFACQQIAMKGDGVANYTVLHGVQQGTMTTTFNLDQVYTMGQLGLYANQENVPDIEVSLSKCLDGYPLLWHSATVNATSPTLPGRSTEKCLIAFGIFADTSTGASGTPQSEVETSGMFPSSIKYNFPVDGVFTEDMTCQGNDKIWANDSRVVQTGLWAGATTLTYAGQFTVDDTPIGSGSVNRRQNMLFDTGNGIGNDSNGQVADPDATILPPDVFGISSSGTNPTVGGTGRSAHIQSISVSCDLNREPLYELGTRAPYTRTVNFPVEVTCEIGIIATSGDMVSASTGGILNSTGNACINSANLTDRTIRIATCEGTRLFLGKKNKLASVNYSGGDAGGGNVEVSYSFSNFNELTVLHSADPNSLGATWWSTRTTYLT